MIERGSDVHAFDPLIKSLDKKVVIHKDLFESVCNSEVLIVATDWADFKDVNWLKVKSEMKGKILIDGRNMFDPQVLEKHGFYYLGVGRPVDNGI